MEGGGGGVKYQLFLSLKTGEKDDKAEDKEREKDAKDKEPEGEDTKKKTPTAPILAPTPGGEKSPKRPSTTADDDERECNYLHQPVKI